MHDHLTPSPWLLRWAHLIAPASEALDVACGNGRHMRWLAEQGHAMTGVDRSAEAVQAASAWGHVLQADIEAGPWPFADRTFGAVVVTNYLWRPRLPDIADAVAPGGVLIYETFAQGNETVGKPSRPDFLLAPGELLTACAGFRIVAYEDGFVAQPDRFVQRVAAVRPGEPSGAPARHVLSGHSACQ
ncbi:MAG: class I SAM-dependent methyltransferase [Gammaproteobacteria bacterium]|nr:class I SAM-dependent methyltransferase [Gammaproteobacteria bacterium]MBU1441989.1 class I SAM-dependent methyltransferase [Gammaproteobacteria bacterium]